MDTPSEKGSLESFVRREPVASIMFVFSVFLIVFLWVAGAVFARTGHAELLIAALVLTGAFALAGIGFGLMRSLRRGRAAAGK